jgi:UDP-GlcNAc3NAcA epimerase
VLNEIGRDTQVILPLHPRTKERLDRFSIPTENIQLIDPVGYLEMIRLEKNASLIVTDSGGIQKEAFFHKVPCVTLRDETEWLETVDLGWNQLAAPENHTSIEESIRSAFGRSGVDAFPYGRGDSSERIVQEIQSYLG